MSNTPSKQLGTTFAKICFGIFFLVASVLDVVDEKWRYKYDYDSAESADMFYIPGSICLLCSIVMEAFGPIKRNLYRTFFHIIGGICIMLATLSPQLSPKWNEFVFENVNFIPGLWLTGGLLLALCQAHFIYCCRSRGCLIIFTLLLAMLGSTFFMIVGILRTNAVVSKLLPFTDAAVFIFASVLYILHALMYSFACNKMNQQDQDDSGTPDHAYDKFPISNPDERV